MLSFGQLVNSERVCGRLCVYMCVYHIIQDVGSVMATLATQSGESFTAVWSFLTDPQ